MAGIVAGVVAIKEQQGNQVLISLPMTGFPEGTSLRPRDQVAILCGEQGPVVYPHTPRVVVDRLPDNVRGRITAEGRELVVADSALRVYDSPGEHLALFIVENESSDVPPQVISIRRVP